MEYVMLVVALVVVLVLTRRARVVHHRDDGRDRAVLIAACLNVADLLDSDALREQIVDALADVGVLPVFIDEGEPFDPTCHRAVGRVPSHDASFNNLVAGTERPGYSDRGRRLRWPDVLVFDANEEMAA